MTLPPGDQPRADGSRAAGRRAPAAEAGDALAGLLPAVRAGDAAARNALVTALYAPVRRMLSARFRRFGEDEVEDLTQEAMSRIAGALGACSAASDRQLYAWMHRTTWSAILNYLAAPRGGRLDRVWRVRWDELHAYGPVADPDAVGAMTDAAEREPDAPDGPPSRQRIARLAVEAHDALPVLTRELLWRRLVEGAGWEELGREVGASGPAMKRRFERACAQLAHAIAIQLGVSEPTLRALFPTSGPGTPPGSG